MAYYLGQNNTGDLGSILKGAYAASTSSINGGNTSSGGSGGASPPQPPTPPEPGPNNSDTTSTGGGNGQPCVNGQCKTGFACKDGICRSGDWIRCAATCYGKGAIGSPEWKTCFDSCIGNTGGRGGKGEPCTGTGQGNCAPGLTCSDGICKSADMIGCSSKCLRDGFRYPSPGFDQCYQNCMSGTAGHCDKDNPCTLPEVCVEGKCIIQEAFCDVQNPCADPAKECVNGKCVPKKVCNPPCVAPKVCENGICVDKSSACPRSGSAYDGCACGIGYSVTATEAGKCAPGYVYVARPGQTKEDWKEGMPWIPGAVGTCQCQKAIDDWKNKKKGQLGEYQYPPEIQQLMDLLLSRGKEFLGMPLGLSQEAQDKQFGRNFENIRAGEAGARNTMEQGLSRQGMLGTGAGQGMLNDLSWGTEGNIANLARDLFVQNELKKKQDLLDYSGAAQGILGSGMNFESLLESINSARRGEGSAALQALLAWLMSQK